MVRSGETRSWGIQKKGRHNAEHIRSSLQQHDSAVTLLLKLKSRWYDWYRNRERFLVIDVRCPCGETNHAEESLIGKSLRCTCGRILRIERQGLASPAPFAPPQKAESISASYG